MRPSDLIRAIPDAVRPHLPASQRKFHTVVRPWLVQIYFGDEARIHYEVSLLASRYQRGGNTRRIEIGLHAESRDHAVNARYLALWERHLFEIKEALGAQVEAEPWDHGWTKCYETVVLDAFDEAGVARVAARVVRFIEVLNPL